MRLLILTLAAGGLALGATPFDRAVRPVLGQVCLGCHNDKLQSGGLNVTGFLDPASVRNNRGGWERILAKLRAGEMPPAGVLRPPVAQMEALTGFIQAEFDREDREAKPDPADDHAPAQS